MSRTSEPLVSVVLPCFNYGRYLPDCLQGVFGQRGKFDDIEVIAIDDCSTDDTFSVLESYNDPRLRIIRHDVNRGHVFTVNEGLAEARGRFVARLDPDDRWRPEFLATLLPCFNESARIGVVYGDAAIIDAEGRITAERCDQVHGERDFRGNELLALLKRNFICAPTAIARREAWQRFLPIWDGLAFNDWYFNVMMAREYDFAYVHRVVADYRIHSSNHHSRIVLQKLEEPSLMRVLDWVFSHPEKDPNTEHAKQREKSRLYAAWYLDQAEKYFGVGYDADARRCYREAFRRKPTWFLNPGLMRRSLGSLIGLSWYRRIKDLVRWASASGPSSIEGSSGTRY